MVGRVRKYDALRGFGFIMVGFREEFFFHVHQWKSDVEPKVGMVVTFEVIPANKAGFQHQAGNVKPVETAEQTEAFVVALNDGGTQ
jgi:cold shock CspA family protein